MPKPASLDLERQEAQDQEADRPRRGRPPGRKLPPGIAEPRQGGVAYEEERPVDAARRALHPDDFDSYAEVKPESAETVYPLFQAQVVYLGNNSKKSVSISGTIFTVYEEQPDGSVKRMDTVVPLEGSQVYEFWTTDLRGRRMPIYDPHICGCAHALDDHPADPTVHCAGEMVVKADRPKTDPRGAALRATMEPCDCRVFSPRGRLMPMNTRDEAIRGRPMQYVQHPEHLRYFFHHRENGNAAFKVRILPSERRQWLEWVMRVERAEDKRTQFVEGTMQESASGWYIHATG